MQRLKRSARDTNGRSHESLHSESSALRLRPILVGLEPMKVSTNTFWYLKKTNPYAKDLMEWTENYR